MPEAGETTKTLRRGLLGPTTSSAPGLNIRQSDASGIHSTSVQRAFRRAVSVLTLHGRMIVLRVRGVFPIVVLVVLTRDPSGASAWPQCDEACEATMRADKFHGWRQGDQG